MLFKKLLIMYKCTGAGCGMNKANPFTASSTGPMSCKQIEHLIEPDILCEGCHSPMDVKRIVFNGLDDIYGSNGGGEWVCPNHMFYMYRPITLKMVNDRYMYTETTVVNFFAKYQTVLKAGHPWKCPDCNSQLMYKI